MPTGSTPQPGSATTVATPVPSRKRLRELLANPKQRASAKKGKAASSLTDTDMASARAEGILRQER